jgi:peptidyl-prolyl cis-trans isomerase D
MFDLFRRKNTNLRILLTVLLGLVALSMVITLIPGFGSVGITAGMGEEKVATVCGEPVTAREVRLKIQQMLNRQQLPPETAAIFIPQFVDQYVAVKGVACFANEVGLKVNDQDIALKIQKDVPSLWQDGKFVGAQMYQMMLKQAGLTIAQFEDSVRKDLETQRLRTLILMSAVATPKEVEDMYRETEERIKLDYFVLDPQEIARTVQIPEEELRAEYEKNKANYRIPESRNVTLYIVDASQVQSRTPITEEDLRRSYQENIENFRSPERAKVRHILFKTQDKPESEDAKMRQLAETVYKQLKAGAKFEELAAKYSEDPGSKGNGGQIGFIMRGQTVKNFDEYSFTAPLKTLSSPIKTEFGYHLIEVEERLPAGTRSFEEVRGALENELRAQRGRDGAGKAADQLRAELRKDSKQLPATAKQYGIEPVRFNYADPSTSVPGLGPKEELFQVARTLKAGEVSEVITLAEGRLGVLVVNEIVPPQPMSYEQAKGMIRGAKAITKGQQIVEQLKAKASAALAAPGADFAKVAKEVNATVKQTQEFNRQGFADGIGPGSAVADAFRKSPGQTLGPITVDAKWFFVKVVDKREADMKLLEPRRAEFVNLVKNRKASERADIFEETLVKKMIADGKIKVFEDARKRIVQGYGG